MANNTNERDDGDLISPAEYGRIQETLKRRIVQALESTRVAQYVRNGHIEIIIRNSQVIGSVRIIPDL